MSIETIVQKFMDDALQSKKRFEKIASRTVSAIVGNNPNDFADIIREATGYPIGDKDKSSTEMES